MALLLEIRDEDVGLESREVQEWIERPTVRCVLVRGQEVALMHVRKYGYHKLPGGGVEGDESTEEALRREIKEEVGSNVRVGTLIGEVVEWKSQWKIHQVNACYLAEELEQGEPDLTQEELERGFVVEWMSLDEAIATIEREHPDHYPGKFIVKRELAFLKKAKEFLSNP